MTKYLSFAAVLFLPFWLSAQVTITGRVLNMTDTRPIAGASVFLSNTTIGNESAADGYFSLYNVKPGKYDLVVSVIGFETYEQSITVGHENITLPAISLVSQTIKLKSVRIKPDNKWFRLYNKFKEEFFGSLPYASECKILNPDSLDLDFDAPTSLLTARSRGFLIIENKALGYRIKYLLERFGKDYSKNSAGYQGYTIFTEMKGTPAEKKKWAKNRLDCYNGSTMHFFRSAIADRLAAEGFEVYPMRRKLDTTSTLARYGVEYKYIFIDSILETDKFIRGTNIGSVYAIKRPLLYVIYKNRVDYGGLAPIYKEVNMPNWQSSVLSLYGDYALFDSNGVLIDPRSISIDGYWALMRVAEQLPVDYEPKKE